MKKQYGKILVAITLLISVESVLANVGCTPYGKNPLIKTTLVAVLKNNSGVPINITQSFLQGSLLYTSCRGTLGVNGSCMTYVGQCLGSNCSVQVNYTAQVATNSPPPKVNFNITAHQVNNGLVRANSNSSGLLCTTNDCPLHVYNLSARISPKKNIPGCINIHFTNLFPNFDSASIEEELNFSL